MAKRLKSKITYLTPEPDWSKYINATSEEERTKAFERCDYFVHFEVSDKDKTAAFKKWLKSNSGYSKEEISDISRNPDWAFGTVGKWTYIHNKIGYMPATTLAYIHEKKKPEWLERAKTIEYQIEKRQETLPKSPVVISVQQRMKDQVSPLLAKWDDLLDKFIFVNKNIDVAGFDPYNDIIAHQPEVKGPHAKIIKDDIASNLQEATEVVEWEDEQLKEGYAYMDAKMRKAFLGFWEKIDIACDTIIKTKSVTRKSRKPKSRSKEKIVEKLKYQVNDGQLGIVSVTPTDIVYANEVWIYNTKTRKVGVYIAEIQDPKGLKREGAGVTVKGTTIIGFDEKKSVQKTLRKPPEQINNWTGKAKTKYHKAFDEIKTTPVKLNGRLNDTTIILQTF